MAEHILHRKLHLDLPIKKVFSFFTDAGNLQKICPPEIDFTILTPQPITMQKGTLLDYMLSLRGISFGWKTLISKWNPPYSFTDESLRGPYKQWIHFHAFSETETGGTLMEDTVSYRLPFAPFGDLLAHWFVKRELDYIFDYREKKVLELLETHENSPN